jgi:hypothetical protein
MHKDSANGHSTPNPKNDLQGAIIPAARVNAPQEPPVPPLADPFPFEGEDVKQAQQTRGRTPRELAARAREIWLSGEEIPLPTWLYFDGIPDILANTINQFQGQPGSNKSRFAETLVACALGDPSRDYCGYTRAENIQFHVLYFDTERSAEQAVPRIYKRIFKGSGYQGKKELFPLEIVPLTEQSRTERLGEIERHIQETRESLLPETALLIVVDVVTDILVDGITDPKETALYYDLLLRTVAQTNTAFVQIIHENQNADRKARGHQGTEGANKSNTQKRIKKDPQTGCIEIEQLKNREAETGPNVFAEYNPSTGLLNRLSAEHREQKRETTTAERLQMVFSAKFSDGVQERKLGEVVEKMEEVFKGGTYRTHRATLKSTTGPEHLYSDRAGVKFWLREEKRSGKGSPVYLVREQATATAISALEMPF